MHSIPKCHKQGCRKVQDRYVQRAKTRFRNMIQNTHELSAQGQSLRQIAKAHRISPATVHRVLKQSEAV